MTTESSAVETTPVEGAASATEAPGASTTQAAPATGAPAESAVAEKPDANRPATALEAVQAGLAALKPEAESSTAKGEAIPQSPPLEGGNWREPEAQGRSAGAG